MSLFRSCKIVFLLHLNVMVNQLQDDRVEVRIMSQPVPGGLKKGSTQKIKITFTPKMRGSGSSRTWAMFTSYNLLLTVMV